MSHSTQPRRSSRKNRIPVSLNQRLDHKLLGYAAAASAAGVSMMALTQPSQAEIVYTPAHETVKIRGTLALDLNGDGVTDFTFYNNLSSCGSQPPSRLAAQPPECSQHAFQWLSIRPTGTNAVIAGQPVNSRAYVSAFPMGKVVGPEDKFPKYGEMESCFTNNGRSTYIIGDWANVKNLFVGMKFSIDGQTHYGWARLSVTVRSIPRQACATAAVLTGYAYETEPGKPILTGKISGNDDIGGAVRPEATLGVLAIGSARLDPSRREEQH
jgi:hypothetical protein